MLCAAGATLLIGAVVLLIVLSSGGSESGGPEGDGGWDALDKGGRGGPKQRKINESIDRGVAFLKQKLQEGGTFYHAGSPPGGAHPGAAALAGLTLLECGVAPGDPSVQSALAIVRNHAPTMNFTYSIASSILFLDRLNNSKDSPADPNDVALIRNLALRLVAGQNRHAGWAYTCQPLAAEVEARLVGELQAGRFRPGNFFVPGQLADRDDNSIGQFATLALWQARKHGAPVRASLHAVGPRYRSKQNADGSWNYNDRTPVVRDTSTCAGLIGLAVANGVADEHDAPVPGMNKGTVQDLSKDPAVQRGLQFLGRVVGKQPSVPQDERARRHQHTAGMEELLRRLENAPTLQEKQQIAQQLLAFDSAPKLRGIYFDGDNWGDLYFLWSLERMAVIYDLRLIEGKDWYEWGAEIILANQQADGSWRERFPGVPDTCFALLFLKRANVVKDLTDKLRNARAGAAVQALPRKS